MEFILWVLIVVFFIASFVGLLFPIIPSVLLIWLGFLLYQFGFEQSELNTFFWVAMAFFTVLLFVADIIANSYFVKRFGGSKLGENAAAIAVIVGSFITPPFGVIYVPFLTVFIIEFLQEQNFNNAWRASIGSLIGFLSGTVAKVLLQLMMIGWFFILIAL